jgi:hypothetical protein
VRWGKLAKSARKLDEKISRLLERQFRAYLVANCAQRRQHGVDRDDSLSQAFGVLEVVDKPANDLWSVHHGAFIGSGSSPSALHYSAP